MGNVMIPEEIATMAGGPEPIGPPGEPPMAPPGPPMGGPPGMGPEGGGLPPELAGLFGGGPPPGETPPGGPETDLSSAEARDDIEILTEIVDLWMEYMGTADDDIEKSKATQGLKIAQDLLASNQKEQEAAAGVGPAQKGMARALGG